MTKILVTGAHSLALAAVLEGALDKGIRIEDVACADEAICLPGDERTSAITEHIKNAAALSKLSNNAQVIVIDSLGGFVHVVDALKKDPFGVDVPVACSPYDGKSGKAKAQWKSEVYRPNKRSYR